jgi:ATP-binding cassette subfamily A (ABC1) protein 3
LSILGGLIGRSRGSVAFEGGVEKPSRGTIGIVPQKNVLFPELSCYQTLRVWRAVKWSSSSVDGEDLQQLLRDCDLGAKVHANANTLSGGQKRKLQLAIGLLGGSKSAFSLLCHSHLYVKPLSEVVLVDEVSFFSSFEETNTHFDSSVHLELTLCRGGHYGVLSHLSETKEQLFSPLM